MAKRGHSKRTEGQRSKGYRGQVRRFQNRVAREDAQQSLADDILLKTLPPDHPEVKRIKDRRGE